MKVSYDHSLDISSVEGPRAAFRKLTEDFLPSTLLDVGCGPGAWLRAALDSGVSEVVGIDGADIPSDRLLVPEEHFRWMNLATPIELDTRFEMVTCLEVAEHLAERDAGTLIDTLVHHSDRIYFSAACPGQLGQNHLNCQWPAWWQRMFNDRGYCCDDQVRWQLWDEFSIEPWYRQNIFLALKDPRRAAQEPRLKQVIHPAMLPYLLRETSDSSGVSIIRQVENGSMPFFWYLGAPINALNAKARRTLFHKRDR